MIDGAALLGSLGVTGASPVDTEWAERAAAAATEYVDQLPHVDPGAWDHRSHTGALMLAQRIYSARSAPLGAAGMDVTGALVRATTDPEVGRLLRVGRYETPRIG